MILHPSSGNDKIYPVCSVCGEKLSPSALLQKSFLVDGRTVYVDFRGHTDCLKRAVIFGEESSPFEGVSEGTEFDKNIELIRESAFSAPGIWSPKMMPKRDKEKKRRHK